MGAIVIISIFMLIAVFLVAFIVGLSSKGEAKKETAKETTGEGKGWYTAEMKADYTDAVNERKKAHTDRLTRFELGMFEAIHYSRELEEAEGILSHAYHTKKMALEEYQTRTKTVLHDLDRKYPNAREFVTAFSVEENPHHITAFGIYIQHNEKVRHALFEDEWLVDLQGRYRGLYIDILKNENIINYKENFKSWREL